MPSLLLQLLSSTGPQFDDHDPEGTISLTIVPNASAPQTQTQDCGEHGTPSSAPSETSETPLSDQVEQLFSALSACADLHPDATSNSDIDIGDEAANNTDQEPMYTQIDGLPPPMPGSGGWITAENVGEFFDEEGNFRGGGGSLGEGAGVVRRRDEEEEQEEADGNGVEGDRDGEGEETKWRRTG